MSVTVLNDTQTLVVDESSAATSEVTVETDDAAAVTVLTESVVSEITVEQPAQSVVVVSSGEPGPPGQPGVGGEAVVLQRPAHGALSGHRVVVERADGAWEYADNTTADHLHRVPALTLGAAADGEPCNAVALGEVNEPSWSWTPGAAVYLGGDGTLTQTPPVAPVLFLVEVGVALSPNRIFVDPKLPIRLT